MIDVKARGSGYYRVFVNNEQISQHTTEREAEGVAIEIAINLAFDDPEAKVYYDHKYEVDVTISASDISMKAGLGGVLIHLDDVPDQFTFVDQVDVALSTVIESTPIIVVGMDTGAEAVITVTGGEYQINDGVWTTVAGMVVTTDLVKARHISSSTVSTNVDTVVTIGGVVDTFTSTTENITGGLALTSTLTAGVPLTRNNISWTFDIDLQVGQFMDGVGDYFGIDPGSGFNIDTVSPAATGSGASFRNGTVVNPFGTQPPTQGVDGRIADSYEASLTKNPPFAVSAGDSVVSVIENTGDTTDVFGASISGGHCHVSEGEVFTVLNTVPFADSFRPGFAGTTKTLYRRSDMNLGLLPSNPLSAGKPALSYVATVEDWFKRPWLDFVNNWKGRRLHPINNMSNYGREIGHLSNIGAALLCLDYTVEQKTTLATNYVQVGIDLYWQGQNGATWGPDGGHFNGRKWPIVLAGILLNEPALKAGGTGFGEDGHTYYGVTDSANAGQSKVAYFGKAGSSPYFEAGCTGGGSTDIRPVALNSDACQNYRNCCTSQTWVGTMLAILMMGEKTTWNHDPFFDYLDRWMDHGLDPEVVDGGFSVQPNATSPEVFGGSPGNNFIRDMWDQYRSSL